MYSSTDKKLDGKPVFVIVAWSL